LNIYQLVVALLLVLNCFFCFLVYTNAVGYSKPWFNATVSSKVWRCKKWKIWEVLRQIQQSDEIRTGQIMLNLIKNIEYFSSK